MVDPVTILAAVVTCIRNATKIIGLVMKYLAADIEATLLSNVVQGLLDILEQYKTMSELAQGTLSPIDGHLRHCEAHLKYLEDSLTSYARLVSRDAPKAKGIRRAWKNTTMAKNTWVGWGKANAHKYLTTLEACKTNLSLSFSACL